MARGVVVDPVWADVVFRRPGCRFGRGGCRFLRRLWRSPRVLYRFYASFGPNTLAEPILFCSNSGPDFVEIVVQVWAQNVVQFSGSFVAKPLVFKAFLR